MDRNIEIMGIVNLTDNSYFAQSRCLDAHGDVDADAFLGRCGRLVEEGASILDIGACSTGPGSSPVGKEEEWRRLCPALKVLREHFPEIRISVDTYWPEVVERVFDLMGEFIVNDVTAGKGMPESGNEVRGWDDSAMLKTVGRLGLPYVAMHMRGNTKTMQSLASYGNVVDDVVAYFHEFESVAAEAGIRDWIVDPGFGFSKTVEQNYQLLAGLDRFGALNRPVLVGVSRKSMIYRRFGITPEEALPATQVLHFKALEAGASILRVHDVAEAARTVEIYRSLS